MNMIVNSLPSRTWNRLGMNESVVNFEETFENQTPEVTLNSDQVLWDTDAERGVWRQIETGAGKDLSKLTVDAKISILKTAAPNASMEKAAVIHYSFANGKRSVSRLQLHAAPGSTLSAIVLLDTPEREAAGIAALETEIYAEANSKVRLYVVQLLGSGFTCLHGIGGVCEERATIELTKLELGAGQMYAGVYCDLLGQESQFKTDVGYHVLDGYKLDMNYVAEHHGPRTESLMNISGTLENGARKVFRGTIDFPRGCPGAKGTESENVLLMGDDVVNQSIPLILCKEEDVEGNHGASIGKLDDKVLFYLGSRGISEEAAQKMIAQSRIDAICSKIPNEDVQSLIHQFEQ